MKPILTEQDHQIELAKHLDAAHLVWTATANGGKRDKRTASTLKKTGVKPGIPDILIFTPPPNGHGIGFAIELKRPANGTMRKGRASTHQKTWLENLRGLKWRAEIAYGYEHALDLLRNAGYEI